MKNILMFFCSTFRITISKETANKWGLKFHRNVTGSEVSDLKCKSIYVDSHNNKYQVEKAGVVEAFYGVFDQPENGKLVSIHRLKTEAMKKAISKDCIKKIKILTH